MSGNLHGMAILFGSVLMLAVAGCGGSSYKQPTAENCATIRVDSEMAYISRVDGVSTTDRANRTARGLGLLCGGDFPIGKLRVSVTPGKHTIQVQSFSSVAELWLVAEPQTQYVVQVRGSKQGERVWIENPQTGQSVGGIKGSADEPPDSPTVSPASTPPVPNERK
jgi:hypothetical protein